MSDTIEASFEVGPNAITAYARLSYTMWYALAEFIDNSTQSRENHASIIDAVLLSEGRPLTVDIKYGKLRREIVIEDNSIGMSSATLVDALRVAVPTIDSRGRSKYGMGLKTAACWIGNSWTVTTCAYGSGIEWSAHVNVAEVASGQKIPIKSRTVSTTAHYTRVVITELNRSIQYRTEENIREYLGSMYRFDIKSGALVLKFNENVIGCPEDTEWDTDPAGNEYKKDLPIFKIGDRTVTGWVGVLKRGAGGRKFGGFSLFQHRRQIEGFPNAWKPKLIFGGVDVEGANNLVAQRLTGLIELDGFDVSHTKDAILFRDGEQEALEKFLADQTLDYRRYANKRREPASAGWTREKVVEMIAGLKEEFSSSEVKDAAGEQVPPLAQILSDNQKQVAALTPEDLATTIQFLPDLSILVSVVEKSEFEPYLTITTGAKADVLHVIINNLHPYFVSKESQEAQEECIRQYILDAIAEYQLSKQLGKVNPDSARRKKDVLMRAEASKAENDAALIESREYELVVKSTQE